MIALIVWLSVVTVMLWWACRPPRKPTSARRVANDPAAVTSVQTANESDLNALAFFNPANLPTCLQPLVQADCLQAHISARGVRPEWHVSTVPTVDGRWLMLYASKPSPRRGCERLSGAYLYEYVALIASNDAIVRDFRAALDRLAQKAKFIDTIDPAVALLP